MRTWFAQAAIEGRDRLVEWINDPNVSTIHRRLYLTMLRCAAGRRTMPMVEEDAEGPSQKDRPGLDALVSCYLTLRGDGLPLIEEMFLKNESRLQRHVLERSRCCDCNWRRSNRFRRTACWRRCG